MTAARLEKPSHRVRLPRDGASLIHQASRTLSNDEIKAWADTEIDIAGAPGEGRVIYGPNVELGQAFFVMDVRAGAYTNVAGIDPNGTDKPTVRFRTGDGAMGFGTGLWSHYGEGLAQIQALLAVWGGTRVVYAASTWGEVGISNSDEQSNQIQDELANAANKPLRALLNNRGYGALTGGAAGNTLTITCTFQVWDDALKRFLTISESGWNESARSFA